MTNCEKCNKECKKLVIKYKTKSRVKKILTVTLILFFLIFLLAKFVSNVVNPVITAYGEAEISSIITKSANESISMLSTVIVYDQMVKIDYNTDGSVALIAANTEQINKISNILAQNTQNKIDNISNSGLEIPWGSLTGLSLLSGKGGKIKIPIDPKGNVLCHFYSEFLSQGINQTNHRIYVNIEVECFLILPFLSKSISKSASYLLSECLIVGKVPQTYLGLQDLR